MALYVCCDMPHSDSTCTLSLQVHCTILVQRAHADAGVRHVEDGVGGGARLLYTWPQWWRTPGLGDWSQTGHWSGTAPRSETVTQSSCLPLEECDREPALLHLEDLHVERRALDLHDVPMFGPIPLAVQLDPPNSVQARQVQPVPASMGP